MQVINLGVEDGLPPVDWDVIVAKIESGEPPARDAHNSRSTWLATLNDDGSPHVTAVGAIWIDGAFWFQTGETTKKHANLDRDPRCTLALSLDGADVVIEGEARRVTDRDEVARAAKGWADTGWPAEPDESGTGITAPFNAPSQGPPPWHVYCLEARSATAVLSDDPGGLTRFRF